MREREDESRAATSSNSISVGGNNTGQIVQGFGNVVGGSSGEPMSRADREALRERVRTEVFAPLEAEVAAQADPGKRASALERLGELREAVTADEPKGGTVEYVLDWFRTHLPKLAGAVAGVVVNPIVGKLVEAAGEAAAGAFKRRLGISEPKAPP